MTSVLDRPAVTPTAEPTTEADDELILDVIQEDIDRGLRGNKAWCPIALAANRLGRGGQWHMSTSGILEFWPQGGGRRERWLSVAAGDFAFAFDHNIYGDYPRRFVFLRIS